MTKSARYFWDAESVKEVASENNWESRYDRAKDGQKDYPTERVNGIRSKAYSFARSVNEADRPTGPNQHREDREDVQYSGTRNLRTIWTIATQPTREAHFATFPEALVEKCIKAGSRMGDIVFDPFVGSGTTARVAIKLNRRAVGLELSMKYLLDIAVKRTSGLQPTCI